LELNVRFSEVYRAIGEPEKALSYLEKADRFQPGNPEVVLRLASLQVDLGEYEHAYELIQPFIRSDTPFMGAAILLADFCHKTGHCDEALAALQRLLTPATMGDDEMRICFAIGRLLDRKKEFRKAFSYFKRANDLYSRPYDYSAEQRWLATIKNKLGRELFSTAEKAGYRPKIRPVFIVGMPRSGTSLVEQILSSHPMVQGAGERVEISQAAVALTRSLGTGISYPASITLAPRALLDRLAGEYIEKVSAGAPDDSRYLTDKMPHNYRHLGLIQLMFPEAKVIHCKRGAMDTCLSNYFTLFRGAHEYSYSIESLAQKYLIYNDAMRHWKNVLDMEILDLRYEQLVASPEKEIRRLLAFCGLDWTDKCLEFYANRRAVVTASRAQVRQPLYSGSVERWRNYEEALTGLRRLLAAGLDPDSI
jgi:tetratricopeptide (TPR) repeat protein